VTRLREFLQDEAAQGVPEYAIIMGVLIFAAIVTFAAMGDRLRQILGTFLTSVNQVPTS
jgi:Flp pilus assembly pilin Flp